MRRRPATQAFVDNDGGDDDDDGDGDKGDDDDDQHSNEETNGNIDFSSCFSELSNILSRFHRRVLDWIKLGDIYRMENCYLMEPDNITIFEINIMLSAWTIHFFKKFSFIELLCQLLTPG